MDKDVKAILLDIAAQLKERNGMVNQQEERRRAEAEKNLSNYEKVRERSEARIAQAEQMQTEQQARGEESRIRLEESHSRAEEDRARRVQFQTDLLQELRRLNANFEAFLTRGDSL